MDKINILHIENFGYFFGGGQRSLFSFLERCDRDRFRPVVVCPYEDVLSTSLRKISIDTRIVKMPPLLNPRFFEVGKAIFRIRKLIREEKISLVHANGSRSAFYGGMAAKKEQVPLIWHVRIADSDGLWDRFLAGLSTQIITISDAVNQRFNWMKDRQNKVKAIYNGIDLAKFNPDLSGYNIRHEFGLNPETPLVGTVGRLDWYKGHKYLLEAARRVVDSIPDCRFLIVGEGVKRKELEDITAKLKLNNNVIFAGQREDTPEILASLNLFVLSSVSEGLGRSLIEAMACGKPVVATRTGGIPEVVEEEVTGLLVSPADPLAFSKAITILLKNIEKSRGMGLAGRRRAENLFDIKVQNKKIEDLYMKILEK